MTIRPDDVGERTRFGGEDDRRRIEYDHARRVATDHVVHHRGHPRAREELGGLVAARAGGQHERLGTSVARISRCRSTERIDQSVQQAALGRDAEHLADLRLDDVGIHQQHVHVFFTRHAECEIDRGERLALAAAWRSRP